VQVTYLPVQPDGLVDLQLLKDTIRPQTALVSIMMVNNEIGEPKLLSWHLQYAPASMEQCFMVHCLCTETVFRVAELLQLRRAGTIQPMKEIGELCREHKVFFHTDAAQAVGKMPVDVNENKIDLMSISGHKLYGPKGVGASACWAMVIPCQAATACNLYDSSTWSEGFSSCLCISA
jgi:cysteine desulfurase